jgi:hypothetical protein
MKKYTVVGYHADNKQPLVEWVEAEGASDAITKARAEVIERSGDEDYDGVMIIVVDVFEGHVKGQLANEELVWA